MTYQIAMRGRDGVVLASDQSERLVNRDETVATQNLVKKIRVDTSKQFAWCYAGISLAPVFSNHFASAIDSQTTSLSDQDATRILEGSVSPAYQEWQPTAAGGGYVCILLVSGRSRKIFRNKCSFATEEMEGGWCVAGNEFNVASFLPRRLYCPEMSVQELACLAAYSIHAAHDFDSAFVNGLDIAIYRDTEGYFEFVDSTFYWNEIERWDAGVRKVLTKVSPVIADHLAAG